MQILAENYPHKSLDSPLLPSLLFSLFSTRIVEAGGEYHKVTIFNFVCGFGKFGYDYEKAKKEKTGKHQSQVRFQLQGQ